MTNKETMLRLFAVCITRTLVNSNSIILMSNTHMTIGHRWLLYHGFPHLKRSLVTAKNVTFTHKHHSHVLSRLRLSPIQFLETSLPHPHDKCKYRRITLKIGLFFTTNHNVMLDLINHEVWQACYKKFLIPIQSACVIISQLFHKE